MICNHNEIRIFNGNEETLTMHIRRLVIVYLAVIFLFIRFFPRQYLTWNARNFAISLYVFTNLYDGHDARIACLENDSAKSETKILKIFYEKNGPGLVAALSNRFRFKLFCRLSKVSPALRFQNVSAVYDCFSYTEIDVEYAPNQCKRTLYIPCAIENI